jgi:hypothetical protein
VTAGGLSEDGLGWRKPRRAGFLMPGRVLSVVFRAKLREALERLGLDDSVSKKAWKQKWVVHVQDAGTGATLIEYLGRYLFRPPISNPSIERFEDGRVTFRSRDGRSRQLRRTTLRSDEFIRRFLLHVLPRGFTRVRHYGCFSPGSAQKLALARSLLEGHEGTTATIDTSPARLDPESVALGAEAKAEDEDPASTSDRPCPFCDTGTMRRVAEIGRIPIERGAPRAPP